MQPVRCVAAIKHAVAVLPLVDRLPGRAKAFCKGRRRLIAALDRRTQLGRRRGLAVKMDQHLAPRSECSPDPNLP